MSVPRPSIFQFTGGEPAFLALATAHHERCPAGSGASMDLRGRRDQAINRGKWLW
jgi:hemoglobin